MNIFFRPKEGNNGSPWINIDITGSLLTLSLSILILNSQCKEGASDVNVHWRTPITSYWGQINTKWWLWIVIFILLSMILHDVLRLSLLRSFSPTDDTSKSGNTRFSPKDTLKSYSLYRDDLQRNLWDTVYSSK